MANSSRITAFAELAIVEHDKALRKLSRAALIADVRSLHQSGKHQQKSHGKGGKRAPAGQVSFEAQPSTSLSPVPGIQDASFSKKRGYMKATVGAMGNPETGAPDELMEASGLDGDAPFEVVGVWKGDFNPGMQAEISRDAKQEDVEAYAASVGKTLKQDAVGYHRPFFDGNAANDQGAEIELGKTISKTEMGSLYSELSTEVGADHVDDIALVASKNGVRALNFSKLPPEEFQAKLGTAAGKAIKKDVSIGTFDFQGGLVENDWKVNPNGEGYNSKIGKGKSDLSGAVERVNKRVGTVNETWSQKLAPPTAASERRIAAELKPNSRRKKAQRAFKVKKCSKCGSKKNLQRHHINTKDPLAVRVLCQSCHAALHIRLKTWGKGASKMAEEKPGEKKDEKKKEKPDLDDETPITKLFFRKFIKALRGLLPEADVNKAMKAARGSAGGEMKKRKRQQASDPSMVGEVSTVQADDDYTPAFRPKKSKEIVVYTEASVIGEQCQMCRFSLGGACRLVEGTIFPDDVCNLWEEKLQLFNDDIADLCAGSRQASELQLFNELLEFSDPPEWIPYLPKPGQYNSPKYGDIYITKERNENFIRNFKEGVYQESLPISSEHIDADQDGAYGWIEEMRMNEDGSVDAKVSWTDRGNEAIENDRFRYFSPEFHDVYKDNKEVVHKDVAVGGALTTRPFFKEDELRPLVASEGVLTFSEGEHSITFTDAASRREEVKMGKRDSGAGAPKPTAFEKFKEGLLNFVKNFKEEEVTPVVPVADPDPAPEVVPVVDPVQGSEKKTANERIAMLEAENRKLKATEAQQATDRKKSSERIEALEDSGHRSTFRDIVMGGSSEARWFGETEAHINHMMSLRKAFGEDSAELKHYIATQQAQVAAMTTAGLFDERGSNFGEDAGDEGKDTPSGAFAELRKLASEDEEFKSGKISFEQSFVRASTAHPELKKKYREQFRSSATVR